MHVNACTATGNEQWKTSCHFLSAPVALHTVQFNWMSKSAFLLLLCSYYAICVVVKYEMEKSGKHVLLLQCSYNANATITFYGGLFKL